MDRWLKGGHFNKKPVTEESLSTQSVEGRINDDNGSQVVHLCNSNANGFMNPIKKRKYNKSYLEMRFSETYNCQPQCVICLKVLPNSFMYPGKLRGHFEKTHPDYEGKTRFSKINEIGSQRVLFCSIFHVIYSRVQWLIWCP